MPSLVVLVRALAQELEFLQVDSNLLNQQVDSCHLSSKVLTKLRESMAMTLLNITDILLAMKTPITAPDGSMTSTKNS